jgi:hypothetical protein
MKIKIPDIFDMDCQLTLVNFHRNTCFLLRSPPLHQPCPQGVRGQVMPLYYLKRDTLNKELFIKKEIDAAAGRPFWSAAVNHNRGYRSTSPHYYFKGFPLKIGLFRYY